ncbi:MAG TPA: hypothetical protein VMU99_07860 [Acidimicrobiales bacterium]|nr:hypothetical protein [Acidimicrobiales bacterium]
MNPTPHAFEIKELIASSIDVSAPEPFGTYLFAYDEQGAEIARDLERTVFLEAFNNTSSLLFDEYHRFERASIFICVIDHRRRECAGMMRVILPVRGGPGLKSLLDVEPIWKRSAATLFEEAGLEYDPDQSWDIATLAVAREYRTAASLGLMHIGLYQAIARLGRHFGVKWLVAILDYAVYRLIRLQLRRCFVALAEERSYLGSARSVPACCALQIAEAETRENDSILHELIYVGSTIKPALRQLDLSSAIGRVEELVDVSSSSNDRRQAPRIPR